MLGPSRGSPRPRVIPSRSLEPIQSALSFHAEWRIPSELSVSLNSLELDGGLGFSKKKNKYRPLKVETTISAAAPIPFPPLGFTSAERRKARRSFSWLSHSVTRRSIFSSFSPPPRSFQLLCACVLLLHSLGRSSLPPRLSPEDLCPRVSSPLLPPEYTDITTGSIQAELICNRRENRWTRPKGRKAPFSPSVLSRLKTTGDASRFPLSCAYHSIYFTYPRDYCVLYTVLYSAILVPLRTLYCGPSFSFVGYSDS